MSLCQMPLGGRWEKEGEEWKIIGEEEVETEKISCNGRQPQKKKNDHKKMQ
jgi:hypothetical protein